MTFYELQQALAVFGFGDRATLKEIKKRHRQLVKRHHPDTGETDAEMIRRVNAAYKLLLEYCQNYRFSFAREEFYEQNPEERLREQFTPYGMGEEGPGD